MDKLRNWKKLNIKNDSKLQSEVFNKIFQGYVNRTN